MSIKVNGKINTPNAELDISEKLVKKLLEDQFPELSGLAISKLDEGWDNVSYKLGNNYVLRIPRRQVAAILIKNEQEYLASIQKRIPVKIPVPIHSGLSTEYYPWPWSIVPYYDGDTANREALQDSQALIIAEFLKSLHVPAPWTAPYNLSRASSLADKSEIVKSNLEYLKNKTSHYFDGLNNLWNQGHLLGKETTKKWIHGDLHARNIVAKNGKLVAIIDWGDLTGGDPSTDLACFWMLFEKPEVINEALTLYKATESQITRAKAWAVFFGSFLIVNGMTDNPAHTEMGIKTINSLKKYTLSR